MSRLRELVIAAEAGIENLTVAEVAQEIGNGDVLLVDVREPDETRAGIIPGAVVCPRGLLEFRADPAGRQRTPHWRPGRRVIVYSGSGSRSALAAASLQHLGYPDVAHLSGGYAAWLNAGSPVQSTTP